MLTGPVAWYKARISYYGEVPIEVLPVQTNDPETYEQGLRSNYSTADRVEVWEVDENGEPRKKNAAAEQEGPEPEPVNPEPDAAEGQKEAAKRTPGLGQLFK